MTSGNSNLWIPWRCRVCGHDGLSLIPIEDNICGFCKEKIERRKRNLKQIKEMNK
jgi:hypothetical protein